MSQKKGLIFVLSGPSGSGKTTLAQRVLRAKNLKGKISKTVSFTTRPKRSGEVEGRDYFFITPRQFRRYNKEKKIIEWTRYLGYYYGTPRRFVEANISGGRHLLMCLDLRGARKIKKFFPKDAVTIFVEPPSLEILVTRIQQRCRDTKSGEIRKRVGLARKEILAAKDFDHRILNERLPSAIRQLKKIILGRIATKKVFPVEPHGFTAVAPLFSVFRRGAESRPNAHSSPPLQVGHSGCGVKGGIDL